ncbi:hypothetical protein ACFZA9_21880 [Streptomyces olivaceus]|uniref:hypothetical protein n=1 Tax=Streptomyces olivaceus TaxID=47716 RepID=UPI0036EF6F40
MKTCTTCKKSKPEREFNKNATKSGGLQDKCKKCAKEYYKNWRKNNPDYHPAWYKRKASTEEGREEYRRKSREQYKKNKKS